MVESGVPQRSGSIPNSFVKHIPMEINLNGQNKTGPSVQNYEKHVATLGPFKVWFTSGVNGITWEVMRNAESEVQPQIYWSSRSTYSWVMEYIKDLEVPL